MRARSARVPHDRRGRHGRRRARRTPERGVRPGRGEAAQAVGDRRAPGHRRPELLRAGWDAARQGRGRDRPAHQPAREGLPARGPHAGLAHTGPRLVRLDLPRQEAVRDDQPRVRNPGALAGPLHSGDAGRRARPGPQDPARRADHPQGLPQAHRLLLRVLRGGWQDADRPRGLPARAQPQAGVPRRAGHRLLRRVVGDGRAEGGIRRLRDRGRHARDRRRRVAREGVEGHARRGRQAHPVRRPGRVGVRSRARSSSPTRAVSRPFEWLSDLDEGYRPIPMLADGMPTVSKDGLTYGIKLRKGVKFHNGKEVTSDDVVASLLRWGKRSVYGKSLFAQVADFKATDTYAVEFKLKEKSAIVVISLAVPNNMGAIYPKEIAEKFPPDQRITEWVGTGPFKIAEWKPDQYIRMVRFEDYTRLPGKQSGYGGAKIAYVDELRWIPVPEAASRAAQLESGDLDVADDLVADGYDRLKANANVHPVIVKPYYWLVAVFNKKEGLMTNAKLRQAWQAALDVEPIMKTVAGGKPEFYRMDSSLAFQELPTWHTKIARLPWDERNPDKARRLLKEAGYTGQPGRFMTTQEYKWMYDFALVSKQQLEEVGFKVDLQVMDWSTLGQRRVQPKEYDVFTTGMGNFFDPTHHIYLTPTWPGWTEDEQIATLMAQLARETELKKRQELWAQMTKLFYEKVPVARYGDLFGLRALRTTVKGFNDKTERPRFWGVWLDR